MLPKEKHLLCWVLGFGFFYFIFLICEPATFSRHSRVSRAWKKVQQSIFLEANKHDQKQLATARLSLNLICLGKKLRKERKKLFLKTQTLWLFHVSHSPIHVLSLTSYIACRMEFSAQLWLWLHPGPSGSTSSLKEID